MTYSLEWHPKALRAFQKLGADVRGQLLDKLEQRLADPRVPAAKLSGLPDCYKIKLRSAGYRLAYQVIDQRLVVLVLSVGRRDDAKTYGAAHDRAQE
ncbi:MULTISPECIES: type II toxin-antitoxin system RelE/ParE family toxin [unclassified Pseudomonas]|uniref:type II toxin-antitoxin system RelE family toxin n=1 Tax=unclassified Pseudomonas TaxID=196821 RepID=UPI00131C5226|nr:MULTISPECIES: type II toxin-antitoxin system RelE/ParE family toxin [unclassified Pseudomonas]